ncbi:DUF6088 family protein [Sphingomonas hengshuiensis]|uniref:Type IV toxin-antitoxin system AbiEi family antitoxin domain-containing protein n=1 Tax=Sphingomonas hengshuiensis TaxID=1609977 RepID=A0A7U4J7J0_9SPHN|nr:DUF6088 family protein [Sphingomonas hengshuiensis]AJP71710.1 hypothetical protein TS85_07810 [Sphingomonas hengshuiensis]
MSAMADKIMKRIRGKGRGWVFTPKDFIDFGTRGAVDMALSRLTQSGAIRRVGRGLYDYPKLHAKLGVLSPDADSLAQAVSTQSGDKVFPSGAAAANRLGLSTQVPAKATYATSGPSRVKKVAGRTLALKHARTPLIDKASDRANAVVQAMAHLGRDNIDADTIRRFADRLDDNDMKVLIGSRPQMPGWMGDMVLKIGAARHG